MTAGRELEATYFIRLFAEFESALRSYWTGAVRPTRPITENLVNRIASRRRVGDDVVLGVHSARKYRNSLVHERDELVPRVPIGEARRSLILFLARLPESWPV